MVSLPVCHSLTLPQLLLLLLLIFEIVFDRPLPPPYIIKFLVDFMYAWVKSDDTRETTLPFITSRKNLFCRQTHNFKMEVQLVSSVCSMFKKFVCLMSTLYTRTRLFSNIYVCNFSSTSLLFLMQRSPGNISMNV